MKKIFVQPQVEVLSVDVEQVIAASAAGGYEKGLTRDTSEGMDPSGYANNGVSAEARGTGSHNDISAIELN